MQLTTTRKSLASPIEPEALTLSEHIFRFLFGEPISDAQSQALYNEYLGSMTKADWRAERERQAEEDRKAAWWNFCQGDEGD